MIYLVTFVCAFQSMRDKGMCVEGDSPHNTSPEGLGKGTNKGKVMKILGENLIKHASKVESGCEEGRRYHHTLKYFVEVKG